MSKISKKYVSKISRLLKPHHPMKKNNIGKILIIYFLLITITAPTIAITTNKIKIGLPVLNKPWFVVALVALVWFPVVLVTLPVLLVTLPVELELSPVAFPVGSVPSSW